MRNFKKNNSKKRVSSVEFWNREYKGGGKKFDKQGHLALSKEPSEDLLKFTRFLERNSGHEQLNPRGSYLDIGCGNGRNSIYLTETFGMRGYGFDISKEAIEQARVDSIAKELSSHIVFEVGSITDLLPVADESQTLVLDMMVSHFLNSHEREIFIKEIYRVLKPGGWLFFKTFLGEGDKNAHRMLKEAPGSEKGTYIHPRIRVEEHIFSEPEIKELLTPLFEIKKISKSHGHLRRGQAFKRRSISVYAEKLF